MSTRSGSHRLRIPGIGHKNVDRILRIRKYHRLGLDDLRKLHVSREEFAAVPGGRQSPSGGGNR